MQKDENELFVDLIDIMDANKFTPKFYSIFYKISQIYSYFDESRNSSLFSIILNQLEDEKHNKKYHAFFKDEKPCLHLNKGNRNSNI